MFSHFRTIKGVLLSLILLLAQYGLEAQNWINQSVQVMPPYTNKLSDYFASPGKIMSVITTLNNIDASEYYYYIHGYIQQMGEDGSIRIGTNGRFIPANPSVMKAIKGPDGGIIGWPPYTLTYSDYAQIFNQQNLEYRGISREEVQRNGLPAGMYQICFVVYMRPSWSDTYRMQGPSCSPPFAITPDMSQVEPPIIIQPQNSMNFQPEQAKTVMFSWTMPPGASPSTKYKLKIIELGKQRMNFKDMLRTDSYPAFFETTVTGATVYLYTIANPAFNPEKSYAFVVRAIDPSGSVKFKNDGFSEINTFDIGLASQISDGKGVTTVAKPQDNISYKIEITDPVPVSQVKGKLYYRFKDDLNEPGKKIKTPSFPKNTTTNKEITTDNNLYKASLSNYIEKAPGNSDYKTSLTFDNLIYNKDNTPFGNSKPLAGKKISLVVTYLLSGTDNYGNNVAGKPLEKDGAMMKELPNEMQGVADKVLATAITGADGSFVFNFINSNKELGLINSNLDINHGPNEFPVRFSGKLFKVLRIRVEDKYYLSPDVNIKLKPWEGVDIGTIISFVKSYTLEVKVTSTTATFWDMQYVQGSNLPGISTSLIRKTNIESVPFNEGGSNNPLPSSAVPKTVATGKTNGDGVVIFQYLVQHDPDRFSDKYYVKCTPDKMSGDFIFKEKEQAYYKQNSPDFPFNSRRIYQPDKGSSGYIVLPVSYGEDITWNHQLKIEPYQTSIELYPEPPRIAGILEMKDVEHKPFSNENVVMINKYVYDKDPYKIFTNVKTDKAGRFEFNRLPVEYEPGGWTVGETYKIVGPTRKISTSPKGFQTASLPEGEHYPVMKLGQQIVNQKLTLYPDGYFKAYVVDENGKSVSATIDIDGYVRQETSHGMCVFPGGCKQIVSVAAPSGRRKIIVKPNDKDYLTKDTTLYIQQSKDKAEMVKLVVKLKQKRIRFQVIEDLSHTNNAMIAAILKPVPGATVKLNDVSKPIVKVADKDGFVTFEFKNSGSDFTFSVTPPPEADYEDGSYELKGIKDTPNTVTYPAFKLKRAVSVSGKVTLGAEQKPLENAVVYMETGTNSRIETRTDKSGNYTLRKIPAKPEIKKIYATKPDAIPMIVSQNKNITTSLSKANNLGFNLMIDNELVIPSLFGFKTEITEKSAKQADGTWIVSGNIFIDTNDNFALQDETQNKISFDGLKIKKSDSEIDGIPVGVPVSNQITTDISSLKLVFQKSFGAVQYPVSGNQLVIKGNDQGGALTGKVYVQKSSFNFSEQQLKLNNDPEKALMITDKPGSNASELTTFEAVNSMNKGKLILVESGNKSATVEAVKSIVKRYGVTGLDGKPLKFKYQSFDATSSADSWIEGNTINIATNLQIKALPGMSPSVLNIEAGNLVIHPDKIEPLKSTTPIKFKLEKWQFEGKNWILASGSNKIAIESGIMNTGTVNVPLKNISIEPEHLTIGNYDVNNLSMANIVPVEVLTQNPSFGLNPSAANDHRPHYELRLIGENKEPGVIIRNLPGMKPGDALKFEAFSLFSNGDQIMYPGNQDNNLMLYSVMKIRPLSFSSGADYVNMSCGIDLGLPQLPETSGIIQLYKEGGQIKLKLYPLDVSFKGPGGVRFIANTQYKDNPQKLKDGEFLAIGEIKDKEGINLKANFYRTANAAWVQIMPENQWMPLGGSNTRLANIKGRMEADMASKTWNNLTFSGEMTGFKGMQGNTRKTFTVTGSINAANEKMEVKNIPSSFGNMGLTYDLANSRFIGNLQMDQSMGPLRIVGVANMLVDGGGWYMVAGGKLKTPGLGEFNAGLLIGDYNSMPSNVAQTLMQFAYNKNIPPSFRNGISGFFFTGNKDLPIINIPDWSLNLGVISVSLGAKAGLDARLWMSFDKTGNEYGIGAMAFAYAYLKASSITCTKFGAEARAEMGAQGVYSTSTGAFSVNGCGSFSITGSIKQCFPTPCWSDGICCEGCIGISKTIGIKLNVSLDSYGNTDLSFGFGNCSGQAPMSSGW